MGENSKMNNEANLDIPLAAKIVENFLISEGQNIINNWSTLNVTKTKDSGKDVVTNFDIAVEKNFSELVMKYFPDHGFLGEDCPELFRSGKNGYVWEIDSIDGTKFFAAKIPLWCMTIGLKKNNKRIYGCIYNPVSQQLYTAISGQWAFLNGEKIMVTTETNISKVQISMDYGGTIIWDIDLTEETMRLYEKLQHRCYRLRTIWSGALSLAWLSQGFFWLYINPLFHAGKMVDTAGGLLIAEEAWACIYETSIAPGVSCMIIGNKGLVDQAKKIIGF